jgi:hypothetical protein
VTPFNSNHKQEIKKNLGDLGQHYGGDKACSYADMSIVFIKQVELFGWTIGASFSSLNISLEVPLEGYSIKKLSSKYLFFFFQIQ